MFAIAFLIGLYANSILVLGLLNLYYSAVLIGFTFVYLFLAVLFWNLYDDKMDLEKFSQTISGLWKSDTIWVLLLLMSLGVMLVGALAPETAFDSLWYHLTLPKIYLLEHGIRYIPGGLLYYSTMPKLGELLYVAGLAFGSEVIPKIIHLSFSLLISLAVYLVAKKYVSSRYALLAVAIFFTNIVVMWEATTAYIDLIRTFFEIMALWGLLEYIQTKKLKWLIESSFLMGLAMETKLISVTTLVVYCIVLLLFQRRYSITYRVKTIVIYLILAFVVVLPWFIFSYVHTGNPLYPLFTHYEINVGQDTLVFPGVFVDMVRIFINSADPVSPFYLLLLPLFFFLRKSIPKDSLIIFVISGLSIVIWTLTPKTGGGRFLLPYLPVLSIAGAIILSRLEMYKRYFYVTLLSLLFLLCIAILYRGAASIKYIPVVLGFQSRQRFLTDHLNFSFGDFYDTDGEFKKLVKPSSTVLLYGFHNLYYMDVPFIDASWVKKGDTFEYIATQHAPLPPRFKYWTPIYSNSVTGVTLYTANQPWIY